MWIERIFAGTVLLLAGASAVSAMRPDVSLAVPRAETLALTTTQLPLDRGNPGRDRIGALCFMGAIQLRSTNGRFGGVSGLRAGLPVAGGWQMLGATDTGNWLTLHTVERGGRLVGATAALLAPIAGSDGRPAPTKRAGDAEAIDWNPATGAATVVYEQDHRLVHFAGIDPALPGSLAARPAGTEYLTAMAGWPSNGGGEAMAVMPGGARIVISETARRPDGSRAALVTQAGVTREIGITEPADFSPTDAVALDDHRILVLHRRFSTSGQGAALTLVDLAPALGGTPTAPLKAPLEGRELARWAPPLLLDNMEGLALVRSGGRAFVYIVSDDNLSSLQRTILMKFELPAALLAADGPAPTVR